MGWPGEMGVVQMTEKTPGESVVDSNADEPEVEGHGLHLGREEPTELGGLHLKDEGADEGTDEAGWLKS